ncbi:hypothetical protein L2E82_45288 [Cichorium intybus]|uniref:Uncharacterized protein n=1 Tax=Cichorium intybus TaxID=13427 RepID=A0ACB8ZT44_CICIN|nr:hypothetical protein L2E82_45288 [Cichorium intybus]
MDGWEEWSTNNNGVVDTAFPCLQELRIERCPNLVRVSLEPLPSLRVLTIRGCGHEVLRSLVRLASSVTKLNINDIAGLNDQVWGGVIEYLGEVKELRMSGCNEIKCLWESEAEASKVLVNLSKLDVSSCSKLVSLGKKKEDNCGSNLTSLTSLSIRNCHTLKHCSSPNSLKSLSIVNCNKLLEKKKKKKELEKKLEGGHGLINSSLLLLESLRLHNWPKLKSITQLSSFNHLRNLMIKDCPNVESFPDHEIDCKISLFAEVMLLSETKNRSAVVLVWGRWCLLYLVLLKVESCIG